MTSPFLPAKSRANWCTLFLLLHGIIVIASMASTMAEIGMLQRIEAGEFVSPAETASNDGRQATIGFLYLLTFVAAGFDLSHVDLQNVQKPGPLGMAEPKVLPWMGCWMVVHSHYVAIHAVSSNEGNLEEQPPCIITRNIRRSGRPINDSIAWPMVGRFLVVGICGCHSARHKLFRCPDDKRLDRSRLCCCGIRLSSAGFSCIDRNVDLADHHESRKEPHRTDKKQRARWFGLARKSISLMAR